MKIHFNLSLLLSLLTLAAVPAFTQTSQNSVTDPLTNEVSALRKSVQTLSNRLQIISDELLAPEKKNEDKTADSLRKVTTNLDLLTHAEQRAEVLRKQLLELIEKETGYKSRMTQLDEDMRPENIERSMIGVGGTRAPEMRDTRRRVLDNDRKGIENLLSVTVQSRIRLEDDVRQADLLVSKLRMRLFPLIDKEIDKINPPD
jgi:polyhydroxyalkanoate synthesis regulator phasin